MECVEKLLYEIKRRGRSAEPASAEQMEQLKGITGGKKLPQAYTEFMSAMGNHTYHCFMAGESCYMDEIFDLKEGALELLEENESRLSLTENDFVFWMSQGCNFCFFKLNEGDNPPVYYYDEAKEDQFVRIAFSLTEFYMNYLTNKKDTFKAK